MLKLYIVLNILKDFFSKGIKTREDINTLQKIRLKKQLKYLRKHSPFYKNAFELSNVPIINKRILMEHFNEINTAKIAKNDALKIAIEAEESRDFSSEINGVTVGLSSGTSGNRGLFLVSVQEKAMWVSQVINKVIGFEFRKRKVAFFLRANSNLYSATQSKLIAFHFFDLQEDLTLLLKQLNELQPDILVAQSSVLNEIALAQKQNLIHIKPSKIIAVAEVLEEDVNKLLQNTFHQIIHQVYQCTEGFLASTCQEGTIHMHEDFIIIEKKWIDEEAGIFYPIITDTYRKTLPIIRYELNDILHLKKEPCKCGSPLLAIEKIEGRSDDCFVFQSKGKNIRILPDFIRRAVLLVDSQIEDYKIVQTQENEITIYLNTSNEVDYGKVEKSLQQTLEKFQVEEKIQYVYKKWEVNNFIHKKRRVHSLLKYHELF
jgi:putative adenylate-forming enzyme